MTQPLLKAVTALLATLLLSSAAAPDRRPAAAAAGADRAPERPSVLPGGALDTDCSHVAAGLAGPGYQFIATCPGRSESPDGRFAVVRRGGEQGGVILSDRAGRVLDEIPSLNDAMPFVLFWSPRSTWFFANHYLGSGQDRLRVFEIVNGSAIERSAIFAEATREIVHRYPCVRQASVAASGWRWSRDGRRIAMIVYTRPDACVEEDGEGRWVPVADWEPLWLIGDAETGRIDPASVRVRRNGVGPMPTDAPYAGL